MAAEVLDKGNCSITDSQAASPHLWRLVQDPRVLVLHRCSTAASPEPTSHPSSEFVPGAGLLQGQQGEKGSPLQYVQLLLTLWKSEGGQSKRVMRKLNCSLLCKQDRCTEMQIQVLSGFVWLLLLH